MKLKPIEQRITALEKRVEQIDIFVGMTQAQRMGKLIAEGTTSTGGQPFEFCACSCHKHPKDHKGIGCCENVNEPLPPSDTVREKIAQRLGYEGFTYLKSIDLANDILAIVRRK